MSIAFISLIVVNRASKFSMAKYFKSLERIKKYSDSFAEPKEIFRK